MRRNGELLAAEDNKKKKKKKSLMRVLLLKADEIRFNYPRGEEAARGSTQ